MNKLRQGATTQKVCRRSNAEDRPADVLLLETVVCPLILSSALDTQDGI